MTTTVTPTTELEAVNLMLSCIGESPISTLNDPSSVDAVTAVARLREVSRSVQSKGWHFNTEKNYTLTPEATHGYIYLPANCAGVDTVVPDAHVDITQRGNRLYDRRNHTFTFTKQLKVDMVVLLPFEDLPETARYYIAVRAARIFQDRSVGSETLFRFNSEDEREAKRTFSRAEGNAADHNILTGNAQFTRIISR